MSNITIDYAERPSFATFGWIKYPIRKFRNFCGRVISTFSLITNKLTDFYNTKNTHHPELAQRTVTRATRSPLVSARQTALAHTLSMVDPGSPTHFRSCNNIGVVGIGGQGKSSLINALRHHQDENYDDNDAQTDVLTSDQANTERYQFSDHKYLCELPNLDLARYNLEAFIRRSGLDDYDALIIVQNEPTCCPEVLELFRRAKSKGIPVYVVRSNFDAAIRAEQCKSKPRTNIQLSVIIKNSMASLFNGEIDHRNIFTCIRKTDGSAEGDFHKLRMALQLVEKRVTEGNVA